MNPLNPAAVRLELLAEVGRVHAEELRALPFTHRLKPTDRASFEKEHGGKLTDSEKAACYALQAAA